MIDITQHATIGAAFFEAAAQFGDSTLLAVPANGARSYAERGLELSYSEAAKQVRQLMRCYAAQGYGVGHRVGLALENRPEHLLHKLALNAVGACCVPINPDYRIAELSYLIEHAKLDLIVLLTSNRVGIESALGQTNWQAPTVALEAFISELPLAATPAISGLPQQHTAASILYTSGTTGRPKGCVLSHRYELAAGAWYANMAGMIDIRQGQERLYNPLPLFHVNASILSFFCMMLTGNCQIQTDRFTPNRWWDEVCQSRATIVHYLGIIIPLLLGQPPSPRDRSHCVRFAVGAGVEPQLHALFEQRFGFPLIEIWGMTEMVRLLGDSESPRQIGTRAFGREKPGLQVLVVDAQDREVAPGVPGEMVIRHSASTPRQDFFSGYLDDEVATEHAWRGGWFHTGDIVTRDPDGMLHFVDRNKHIIRRSGENISAAQVEAVLQTHPSVRSVAVLPVADALREQEVLACIVLTQEALESEDASRSDWQTALAHQIFWYCDDQLAYYKAPGWILFLSELPTTGTQKIQKHRIFRDGEDPRQRRDIVDCRALKKRRA